MVLESSNEEHIVLRQIREVLGLGQTGKAQPAVAPATPVAGSNQPKVIAVVHITDYATGTHTEGVRHDGQHRYEYRTSQQA